MNKAELLADIQSKVLVVVKTTEEVDADKNSANVRQYITNVMEQDGDKVRGRNIGWYTIDEGTAQEQALYRDIVIPKSVAREAVRTYMDTVSPSPFIRYTIQSVNEENRSAIVSVMKDNGDNTATEKRILVYKNGASPIAHVELTN